MMGKATMARRRRPPTHPGVILKRQYLDPLGIGIAQAAEALGVSRQSLSKIVHEHRAVTPDMALRLAKAFHTTPELWLNLQQTYDLWHAARESHNWRQVPELVTEGLS
jgi:addiction module HigA family antidote